MEQKNHLTIVACCYNEEKNIEALYREIGSAISSSDMSDKITWHLMLVDDGSEDNTVAVAEELILQGLNIELVELSRNFGKEAALTAGLDVANSAVLLIDADLQHPTSVLPKLIETWLNGADMVIGIPESRTPDFLSQMFSYAYHKLIDWSSAHPVAMKGGDFRLIGLNALNSLKRMRERSRYMKGLYGYVGGIIETIEFTEQNRLHGETKFTYRKRISLAINGLISTTTFPLRFFTLMGLSVLGFAFIYMLYILFEILFLGKSVPGFASLLFSIVILNGLLMLQLGVQSEYISKILEEVKQRPIYIIKKHTQVD